METISTVVIIVGIVFMVFGLAGIFKFNNFYSRILVTSKIDTVGVITLIAGIALRHGAGFFTLKLLLLAVIMLILNPLANHMLARSAYLSDYAVKDGQEGVAGQARNDG